MMPLEPTDTNFVEQTSSDSPKRGTRTGSRTRGELPSSPWLTVREAAGRAKCGERSIYNATRTGRLRAARLGGRRELRFLPSWVDDWLLASSTPAIVASLAQGDDSSRDRVR